MSYPLHTRRVAALALENEGRYEEATAAFEAIVRDTILDGAALSALARMWSARREWDKAVYYYKRAVPALGNDIGLLNAYTLDLARMGRFDEARAMFRSQILPFAYHHPPKHNVPIWDGQDLRGKVLLLDVGVDYFGDALQFVRFARVAKKQGAVVVVRGPQRIRSLLATVPGVDLALAPQDNFLVPDYTACAFWLIFTLEVPFEEMVGETPYIFARPDRVEEWRKGFTGWPGFNVGLVWQGSNWAQANLYARRSMPLRALQPLSEIPGVNLFSLQVGPGLDDLYPRPFPIYDLHPDWENTAAAMMNLDLIVTIDTSISHLAGALGRPTFVMLPYSSCFRWGLEGEDCPWYRSMKLFRQTAPGDWSTVVAQVASRLSSLSAPVKRKHAGSAI